MGHPCDHASASGIDTDFGPDKVWRCDGCGRLHRSITRPDGITEDVPLWADSPMPNPDSYMESELFVAGAISTMGPFAEWHPAWSLPIARQALDALSQWEPSDSLGIDLEPSVGRDLDSR